MGRARDGGPGPRGGVGETEPELRRERWEGGRRRDGVGDEAGAMERSCQKDGARDDAEAMEEEALG